MAEKPSIFDYTDYRAFLTHWMAWKATTGPFSKRWFARQAGFKAPNAFQLVVAGRRNLSGRSACAFARAMALSASETRYFEDLVALNQAPSGAEKLVYYERVVNHPARRRARPHEAHHLNIFQSWLGPIVYEMLAFAGARPDPEWFAERLGRDVTPAQVKRVLAELEAAGLVKKCGARLAPAEPQLDAGEGADDVHFLAYHENALAQAADALRALGPDERYFVVVTAAVPEAALPGLRELAQRHEQELLQYVDSFTSGKDAVVQVGLQVFPVVRSGRGGQPRTRRKK